MCGIFGIISLSKKINIDKNNFQLSLNHMVHRGPDDSGSFMNEKFAFGHRRLSIIDLSKKGKQPMFSYDKSSIITYNGEIYNYQELKKFLIIKGFKFQNNTDTEVLLNGLIFEGPKFIDRCNGMFSFAYHNKKKNEFLLFRDRLGIKPLYYQIEKNNLIFSSNVKSILLYSKNVGELNLESISSYFSYRQPLKDNTYFKKIKSLQPGHFIKIKNNQVKIFKYWDQKDLFLSKQSNTDEKEISNKLKQILETAVDYRLISDVKVASLLSGGLDSSLIASIINKKIDKNFLAYSIGYSYKDYNEFKYSKLVAEKLKMKHVITSTNAEQYFDDVDELIDLRGMPLTIPNEASQYRLCKEIKKKATVVLSGSGADELFCGYGRIFGSVDDYKKLNNLKVFKNKNEMNKFLKNAKSRYGKTKFNDYLDHFLNIYPYTKDDIKMSILSKNFDHKKIRENNKIFFNDLFNQVKSDNYLDKMQYFFQKFHLKGILEREDFSSMAGSIELRVPFLDHRMVEFAATIPNDLKIKQTGENLSLTSDISSEVLDKTKYILRKSFLKNIPTQIHERKKVGFPVPLHIWMDQKKIKDRINDVLLSNNSKNRGIFNFKFLQKLLEEKNKDFKGSSKIYQSSTANKIWMCYNLERFFSQIN